MPLEQRVITPIYASRGIINGQKNIYNLLPNELECFTNETLANIIKQLASLSLYAEDLFGSIMVDAGSLIAKTSLLQKKIDTLSIKVTQLDSTNEDVSLHDIHFKKPYKPPNTTVQEIFSKKTLPKSILELYYNCNKPPPLHLLNPFREDGKDSLKFYTNPNFFFELWRDAMLRQVEKERNHKKVTQRPSSKSQNNCEKEKKPRQPLNTNERYRKMISQQEFLNEEIPNTVSLKNGSMVFMSNGEMQHYGQYDTLRPINNMDIYGTYNSTMLQNQQNVYNGNNGNGNLPPPAYYGISKTSNGHYHLGNQNEMEHSHLHTNMNNMKQPYNNNHLNSILNHHHDNQFSNAPTPPPPYNQLNQATDLNQHHHGTLTRRTHSMSVCRPSQPPPAPPATNGHNSNCYSNLNGYTNHYNQPNIAQQHHGETSMNLNHITQSNNEFIIAKSRSTSLSRDVLPPPPPPPMPVVLTENLCNLPPPPPPMPNQTNVVQTLNISLSKDIKENKDKCNNVSAPPPPPPPPPMPSADVTDSIKSCTQKEETPTKPFKESSLAQEILLIQKQLQPPKQINKPPVVSDPRNDLLAAIREGIKLRRVEDSKQKEVEKSALLDVASILARRVAMELSDSESDAGSDGSESDEWDDGTDC